MVAQCVQPSTLFPFAADRSYIYVLCMYVFVCVYRNDFGWSVGCSGRKCVFTAISFPHIKNSLRSLLCARKESLNKSFFFVEIFTRLIDPSAATATVLTYICIKIKWLITVPDLIVHCSKVVYNILYCIGTAYKNMYM